jgi:hypothetical protein
MHRLMFFQQNCMIKCMNNVKCFHSYIHLLYSNPFGMHAVYITRLVDCRPVSVHPSFSQRHVSNAGTISIQKLTLMTTIES